MIQDDHQNKRCCIVHDNGQQIDSAGKKEPEKTKEAPVQKHQWRAKLKSGFDAARLYITTMTKQMVVKSADGLKNLLGQEDATQVSGKLKSGVAGAVAVSLCVCVVLAFFAPAYDVYMGGKKIGVVSKTEDFDAMLSAANDTISAIAGEYSRLPLSPVYVFRIIPKASFTPPEALKHNIVSLSDAVSDGYTIVADQKPVVSLKTRAEAEEAVRTLKASYSDGDAEIVNQLEIVQEFISVLHISDQERALAVLKPAVSVKTTEVVTYTKEVPFQTKSEPTQELYQGEQKVVQPGAAGSQSVTAQVTKINGVETAADVLSTQAISEPIEQVVLKGTKEKPTGIGSGSFIQPVLGTITSRFGPRWGRTHKGTDIAGSIDTPIKAADNGEVVLAEYKSDYGNLIILDHKNGMQTYYGHLNSMDVAVGDKVEKGQVIGKLGTTGNSTGPHLHFEVRKNGEPCNPAEYVESLK